MTSPVTSRNQAAESTGDSRVSGLVTSLSSTSFTFSVRTCISAYLSIRQGAYCETHSIPLLIANYADISLHLPPTCRRDLECPMASKRQPKKLYSSQVSTPMMRSATCALLTMTSPGQASPPPQCPEPRPLQLGPRLPPRRLHHPHERLLRRHVHPVLSALLPWPGSPDWPPVDGFGAHAVWHAI
jgi:hypothetical protein